jgi:hypothetical protein
VEARSTVGLLMDSEIKYHINHGRVEPSPIGSIRFFNGPGTTLEEALNAAFEIYVEYGCAPELAAAVFGRPSFPTPDSADCFDLIGTWMTECINTHGAYCPYQTETPLPTRALDVGMERNPTGVSLKVTTSEEVGAYVTLSHCVRVSSFLKLSDRYWETLKFKDLF